MVPGGLGALLATTVKLVELRTISAARRALRNRCPLIDKHSYPGLRFLP